jgi:tetratricopeptide (TPR) repeat protein
MPTMVANEPTEMYLGGSDWGEAAVVQLLIMNEIGRVVSEPLARSVEAAASDFQFRRIVLSPVDLPPGRYSMRVTVADAGGGEVLRRATRLAVVTEGGEGGWYGVGESATAALPTLKAVAPEKSKKIKKKEIRAAYRQSLQPLGDGDTATARRKVADFERRMTAVASQSALRSLAEAEIEEARALAKVSPTCLMPLALLHRDLYRSYELRREWLLSAHARNMAITYAELFGRSKSEYGFSEGLMVNFAFDLAGTGALSAARDILERALRFNHDFRPALLSLGFSFEQGSRYQEATTVYRSLVDAHPDFAEGHLRLAVNLMRTGRVEAGEDRLRALLGGDAKTWIQVVAAQELVRHLAAKQSRLPEAEREARAALARSPDDQRLWILLAAILVRLDRHDEAMTVLGSLPRASRSMAPRARYTEWPALDVRASQAFLTEQAEEALPVLKKALASRGGTG